ncbi:MAG: hypothetical protein RI964_304 [Pseudomonadota bacterium]|jgi:hypothetical protein
MPILRFFQYKRALSFGFSELRNIQLNHYDSSVHRGEQPRHNAKKQDSFPSFWRQHRRIAGGNAKSVESTYDGLQSGMRGLQDGANRNKRVVFQKDEKSTRQLCPIFEFYSGVNEMTAKAALGNHAQKPHAQPLRLIPAQVPCKPSLSLHEIFDSLEDLYTLTDTLWSMAQASKSTPAKIRTLATKLTRDVDSLRFRVYDALDAQGGAA